MRYLSDYARVHGLGAAGDGVHHWWMTRITSIALIPLSVAFVIPFGRALGQGHAMMLATYQTFGNALVAVLFFLVGFWHLAQGAQVVIEDYVSGKTARVALLLVTKLTCGTLAACGTLAVATILFRA